MASGLPVVGARSGGTLDLVRAGVTGRLFTPGLASDLRAQLRQIVDDPAGRAAMGQAGRTAAERRSWPTVMDELLIHYQKVSQRRVVRLRAA